MDLGHPWPSPALCAGSFAFQIGFPPDLSNPVGLSTHHVSQIEKTPHAGRFSIWRKRWPLTVVPFRHNPSPISPGSGTFPGLLSHSVLHGSIQSCTGTWVGAWVVN